MSTIKMTINAKETSICRHTQIEKVEAQFTYRIIPSNSDEPSELEAIIDIGYPDGFEDSINSYGLQAPLVDAATDSTVKKLIDGIRSHVTGVANSQLIDTDAPLTTKDVAKLNQLLKAYREFFTYIAGADITFNLTAFEDTSDE